jgi:hypothetical protein
LPKSLAEWISFAIFANQRNVYEDKKENAMGDGCHPYM